MQCDIATLLRDGRKLDGQPLELIELALLCQIYTQQTGQACNIATLLERAKCFACYGPGLLDIFELQLLCLIAGGVTPTSDGGEAPPSGEVPNGVSPCAAFQNFDFGAWPNGYLESNWTEPLVPPTITTYQVWRRIEEIDGLNYLQIATVIFPDASYEDSQVMTVATPGMTAHYRIRACNAFGCSGFCETNAVTIV